MHAAISWIVGSIKKQNHWISSRLQSHEPLGHSTGRRVLLCVKELFEELSTLLDNSTQVD